VQIKCVVMDLIHLFQGRVKWQGLLTTVMDVWASLKTSNLDIIVSTRLMTT
jgi:hypothetical protein